MLYPNLKKFTDTNIKNIELLLILITIIWFVSASTLTSFFLGMLLIWGLYLSSRAARPGFQQQSGFVWNGNIKEYGLMLVFLLFFILTSFLYQDTTKNNYKLNGNNIAISYLVYPLYGLAQLFFFQSIITNRLSSYMSREKVIFMGALLFSLFHYRECCRLMVITFFLGAYYTYYFLKYRSILPLALMHGVLATTFYYFIRQEDVIGIVKDEMSSL